MPLWSFIQKTHPPHWCWGEVGLGRSWSLWRRKKSGSTTTSWGKQTFPSLLLLYSLSHPSPKPLLLCFSSERGRPPILLKLQILMGATKVTISQIVFISPVTVETMFSWTYLNNNCKPAFGSGFITLVTPSSPVRLVIKVETGGSLPMLYAVCSPEMEFVHSL